MADVMSSLHDMEQCCRKIITYLLNLKKAPNGIWSPGRIRSVTVPECCPINESKICYGHVPQKPNRLANVQEAETQFIPYRLLEMVTCLGQNTLHVWKVV